MPSKLVITEQQAQEYQAELEELRKQRETTAVAYKHAKDEGDLSENSTYDMLKDQLAGIDARVQYIQEILEAEILAPGEIGATNSVYPGTTITLEAINDGGTNLFGHGSVETKKIKLVSIDGRPPNIISTESLLGTTLLGKKLGAVISYWDNKHIKRTYRIAQISTGD